MTVGPHIGGRLGGSRSLILLALLSSLVTALSPRLAAARDAAHVQFDPVEGWTDDVYHFTITLPDDAIADDETGRVELVTMQGDLLVDVPLRLVERSPDARRYDAATRIPRAGATRYRLIAQVASSGQSRILVGDDARPVEGPVVLARTLILDVAAPPPIQLSLGQHRAVVRLTASAAGGDENYRFRWGLPGAAPSEGASFLTELSASAEPHLVRVRVIDGRWNGQEVEVGVRVEPAPSDGRFAVVARVDLDECGLRTKHRCGARLIAEPSGDFTPPVHFTWEPSVTDGTVGIVDGAEAEHVYGPGRHIARVRARDAKGRQASRDVIVQLRHIRVAIAEPALPWMPAPLRQSLASALGRSLIDGTDELVAVSGVALAEMERRAALTTAELCEALADDWARAARKALDHPIEHEGILCVRPGDAAAGYLGVELDLFGLAGHPRRKVTVSCAKPDEQCVERVARTLHRVVADSQTLGPAGHWRTLPSAPDAPVHAVGQLTVDADAPETVVWLNGAQFGTAPRTLTLHSDVEFIVELSSPNCPGRERFVVRLETGEHQQIWGQLCQPGGRLTVTTDPPGAGVMVDGRPVRAGAVTPLRGHPISLGRHEVTVFHTGYQAAQLWVDVEPGPATQIYLSLSRLSDALTVLNHGLTRHLYVDGKYIGVLETGAVRTLTRLEEGEHVICVHYALTSQLEEATCRRATIPTGVDLAFDEQSPAFVLDTSLDARYGLAEGRGPLRLSVATETHFSFGVQNSRHWVDTALGFGGRLGVENVATPLLQTGYWLGYTFAEGDNTLPTVDRALPTTVQQHVVELGGVGYLPFLGDRIAIGAVGEAAFFTETINPGTGFERKVDERGFAVGPMTRVRLLGQPLDRFALLMHYRFLFVLGPRTVTDRLAQLHRVGLNIAVQF